MDASGAYTFPNVEPGTYDIEFVLPQDYVFTTKDAEDGTTDSDAGLITGKVTVTVAPEEQVKNIYAGVYLPEPSITGRVFVNLLVNGIQDPSEGGLKEVTVNLKSHCSFHRRCCCYSYY
jgi:hypothetical protein